MISSVISLPYGSLRVETPGLDTKYSRRLSGWAAKDILRAQKAMKDALLDRGDPLPSDVQSSNRDSVLRKPLISANLLAPNP